MFSTRFLKHSGRRGEAKNHFPSRLYGLYSLITSEPRKSVWARHGWSQVTKCVWLLCYWVVGPIPLYGPFWHFELCWVKTPITCIKIFLSKTLLELLRISTARAHLCIYDVTKSVATQKSRKFWMEKEISIVNHSTSNNSATGLLGELWSFGKNHMNVVYTNHFLFYEFVIYFLFVL